MKRTLPFLLMVISIVGCAHVQDQRGGDDIEPTADGWYEVDDSMRLNDEFVCPVHIVDPSVGIKNLRIKLAVITRHAVRSPREALRDTLSLSASKEAPGWDIQTAQIKVHNALLETILKRNTLRMSELPELTQQLETAATGALRKEMYKKHDKSKYDFTVVITSMQL